MAGTGFNTSTLHTILNRLVLKTINDCRVSRNGGLLIHRLHFARLDLVFFCIRTKVESTDAFTSPFRWSFNLAHFFRKEILCSRTILDLSLKFRYKLS